MFLVASKPSSWLRSSSIVLCTSLSPPEPPSKREDPMESISSMKMIEGACSRAITNSSRTIRAPGAGRREKRAKAVILIQSGKECEWGEVKLPTLSNELLHKFRARHSDEGTVGVVSYSSGQKGLSSTGRTIQEHTLQGVKATYKWQQFALHLSSGGRTI